jgi:GAF domain-containing protein
MAEENAESSVRRGQPSAQGRLSSPVEDLSQRLADLARDMQRQSDNAGVMDITVAAVAGTIPGAEEASISLAQRGRRVVSAAATSDVPRRFDDLQTETGQGPCMDSMYEHETIRVDDLAADERWPELARRGGEVGMASLLCVQLFVEGDDLGALNVMARRVGAFTDESERIGLMFASHAAVAVAQARKLNHLGTALASRDLIGQAKGVLMERYKITADQAFALLAKVSQDTNRKLHEVAEYLTDTGVLAAERQRGTRAAAPPREGG